MGTGESRSDTLVFEELEPVAVEIIGDVALDILKVGLYLLLTSPNEQREALFSGTMIGRAMWGAIRFWVLLAGVFVIWNRDAAIGLVGLYARSAITHPGKYHDGESLLCRGWWDKTVRGFELKDVGSLLVRCR